MPFMLAVSSASYISNDDGDGIYTSYNNRVVKSVEKVDYSKLANQINHSNFIISHQRLSSSGFTAEFTHPFENNDFVFVHNGVMNSFIKEHGTSDSFGFFEQFVKEFNSRNGSRERDIVGALRKLFSRQDCGWYSIAIYDKITRRLYYFKDDRTRINFYRHKGCLFITTNDSNKKFLSMLGETTQTDTIKKLEIRANRIYRIFLEQDYVRVLDIGQLREPVVEEEVEDEKNDYSSIKICDKCGDDELENDETHEENGELFCSSCWAQYQNEKEENLEE
jgi:hypothetical protein